METKELNPTWAAAKDEYYIGVDVTCSCSHEDPHLVSRNAAYGKRKLDHVCGDCLEEMREAPQSLFDPQLIATNPDHE
jgi:hypothetical protein